MPAAATGHGRGARRVNVLARIVRVLLFGIVLGAIASLFAIGFVDMIKWLNGVLFVTSRSRHAVAPESGWSMLIILLPAAGGLLVGLLVRLIPNKRPHTPADVIRAAQSAKALPVKAGLVTAGAALIGLGSGASVGQYGPLVHLGGTIGSAVSRFCKAEPGLGIGCGVAAAISTAFSAPIAGIIFAHEVVLRHYSLRAFAPVTVASTTGLFIADQVFHRPALFEVSVARSVAAPEFFAFVLIGVSGALVAVVYMRAILIAHRLSDRVKLPPWLKPAIAGLGVGIAAHWIPEILGAGAETLRFAITPGAYGAAELSIILVAKIVATALCLGFGFAGGVFSPALLIGVLFGAVLGHGAEWLFGAFYSGLEFYAICGMAAVTSPVIGAPLATILIVFELTRNYELTTAVMVSVAFSNLVAYRLFGRSLFDRQLAMRGFDLSMGRDKAKLAQTGINDHLSTDFVRGRPGDNLPLLKRALIDANRHEVYIVDAVSGYTGVITLNQILSFEQARQPGRARASDEARHHARTDTLRFSSGMSVWDAMEAMDEFVGESIPVIDRRGRLLGVVYESTLVKAYLQTVHKLRAEENAAH